jgi:phenylacetate-CoA ligase
MDFKPDIIMVTPSYSLVIAEEFARQGVAPEDISLKVGIFGAEPWGEGMRSADRAQPGTWMRWTSTACLK